MELEDVKRITVIGTGMMGPGIALLGALARIDTVLFGRSQESINRGMSNVKKALDQFVDNSFTTLEEASQALARIKTTSDFQAAIGASDFVIESIIEDLDVKRELFRALDEGSPEHTILATNTSGLSPTLIASATRRPDRVLATHFWNPPHLVPLVEIGRGEKTSDETVSLTYSLMMKLGKEPVIVKKDVLGFIGNRLQHALFREAIAIVQEGVADPEDVDKVVLNSFGPRYSAIGPFEFIDMSGLDLLEAVHSYLLRDLNASLEPLPYLRERTAKGELGIKTGKGFYDWRTRNPDLVYKKRDGVFIQMYTARKGRN